MFGRITSELTRHAPFTASGAITGIVIMLVIIFGNIPSRVSYTLFYLFHPLHIVLSALVTTAIYKKYSNGKIWAAILVGYFGSIGIATLSDVMIPHLGGFLLNRGTLLNVKFNTELEVPFISTGSMPVIGIAAWKVINSAALVGTIVGYFKDVTKFPHFGHVLLSTWASLFYITSHATMSAKTVGLWILVFSIIFFFLFLAVWVPCCTSDIVFPLLFIRKRIAPHEHLTYNQYHYH